MPATTAASVLLLSALDAERDAVSELRTTRYETPSNAPAHLTDDLDRALVFAGAAVGGLRKAISRGAVPGQSMHDAAIRAVAQADSTTGIAVRSLEHAGPGYPITRAHIAARAALETLRPAGRPSKEAPSP